MDLGISGKRAVVVGGSQGLGLAIAQRLAAEGVDLLLFSRNEERLRQVSNQLQSDWHARVQFHVGDISNRADIEALATVAAETGGAQILILNTPRPPSPMREFLAEDDDDRWELAYRQQLHGALLVLRKLTPVVAASGWGRVVAITSASVKQPMPRHAISSIYRAGVQAALKHLANEVAGLGVTVNAVAPATVMTSTFSTFHDLERRIQEVPVGRAGTPEELAALVVFLASQYAGFITGESVQFDGGQTRALC